jgi:hypothetical protein
LASKDVQPLQQWGMRVGHFEKHFLVTLLVQMKDKSLLTCFQKIRLITTNPTTADSDFTGLSYSNSKNVNISLQGSIFENFFEIKLCPNG